MCSARKEMMMMLPRTCFSMLLLVLLSLAQADDQKDEDSSMTLSEVVEMVEPFGNGCEPKPERSKLMRAVKMHPRPIQSNPFPARPHWGDGAEQGGCLAWEQMLSSLHAETVRNNGRGLDAVRWDEDRRHDEHDVPREGSRIQNNHRQMQSGSQRHQRWVSRVIASFPWLASSNPLLHSRPDARYAIPYRCACCAKCVPPPTRYPTSRSRWCAPQMS